MPLALILVGLSFAAGTKEDQNHEFFRQSEPWGQ